MTINEIVELEKTLTIYGKKLNEIAFNVQINIDNGQKIIGSTMAVNKTDAIIKNYHNLKLQGILEIVESIVVSENQ